MAQAIPIVEVLLVLLGMALLVLELKAPGSFVFAGLAALLFALYFAAQAHVGAPLVWPAVACFLLGILLVGVELAFTPGTAVCGVAGLLFVLAGLVLAGLDRVPESAADWVDVATGTLKCGFTMVGGAVLACQVAKHLHHIPIVCRLVLVPPEDRHEEDHKGRDGFLLGQTGITLNVLGFAGMARIAGRRVDVVAEGECIPAGTPVRVVEIDGMRVVVRRA